jgi:hypothetical protein
VVSYGEKTGMRASYQSATYIYLQRVKFYYRALLITRTNSSSALPLARPAPIDEIALHLPLLSSLGAAAGAKLKLQQAIHL